MVSRRSLLKAAGAISLTPVVSRLGWTAPAKKFRVVHLTDIHIEPEHDALRGVAQCVKKILQLSPRPDFVLAGGDYPFDVRTCTAERATAEFKLLQETLKPLEMPIHHAIGNHDVYGWGKGSPITVTDPLYGKRMFEERLLEARTYRSFDHLGWHFIILDNIQPMGERDWMSFVDDAQLHWLKNDLSGVGKSTPIIVTVHVPLITAFNQFATGTMFPTPNKLICQNGKQVHDLLKHHNVKMVLQGHTHVVEEVDYLDIRYITAGSVCGEWWKGPRLGVHPEGFSVIDIHGDHADWRYVPYGWKAV